MQLVRTARRLLVGGSSSPFEMRGSPFCVPARGGNCGPGHRCYHAPGGGRIEAGSKSSQVGRTFGMIISDRLRELREGKNLSQGDIEKRTGLLRCYISRVENGHSVPAIETLEKLARALEVPLYELFYEGKRPPKLASLLKRKTSDDIAWGSSGRNSIYLHKLVKCLSKATDSDRKHLLSMAQKIAGGRS